ncbi:MAG: PH domain-containing protein [Vicinamibacteraceae bacterium]
MTDPTRPTAPDERPVERPSARAVAQPVARPAGAEQSARAAAAAAATSLGFPEGEPQKLDARVIQADHITNWITTAVLAVGGTIPAALAAPSGSRLVAIASTWAVVAGLWWWGRQWAYLAYAHTSYTVTPEGCEIRRGVVWRRVINVPRSRIQHTDVTQGPLQRAFELATLVLYTAGATHAKVELSGVAFGPAMAIRQYLLHRVDEAVPRHGDSSAGEP